MKALLPLTLFEARDIDADYVQGIELSIRELNQLRDAAGVHPGEEPRTQPELANQILYGSAAIEGLAPSRRETELLIAQASLEFAAKGQVTLGSPVTRLYAALQQLGEWVRESRPPHLHTMQELHRLLMGPPVGPMRNPPGQWRVEDVVIRGQPMPATLDPSEPPDRGASEGPVPGWIPAEWCHVPELMRELGEVLEREINSPTVPPVVLAAWAHHAFVQVHPFTDGNGRTARMLQDHVLWHCRWCPAILGVHRLEDYYRALRRADEGKPREFVNLIAEAVRETARDLIKTYGAAEQRSKWAQRLKQRVIEGQNTQAQIEYGRWIMHMRQVRDAFVEGAGQLAEALADSGVRITARTFPEIRFEDWQDLRRGQPNNPNWYFSIQFRGAGKTLTYVFMFGRHFVDDIDPEEDRDFNRVALKLSLRAQSTPSDPSAGDEILHRFPSSTYPRGRSLWRCGDQWFERRAISAPHHANHQDDEVWQWERRRVDSPFAWAESFFEQVLGHEFGLRF